MKEIKNSLRRPSYPPLHTQSHPNIGNGYSPMWETLLDRDYILKRILQCVDVSLLKRLWLIHLLIHSKNIAQTPALYQVLCINTWGNRIKQGIPSPQMSRLKWIQFPIQASQFMNSIFSPVPQPPHWPKNLHLRSNLRIKYFSPKSPVNSASSFPQSLDTISPGHPFQ